MRKLVGTLAEQVARGHEIKVNCDSCHHRATVDLPSLIKANGEGFRLQAFIERARCSKCGSRWPKLSVTVMPISAPGHP